MENDPTNEASLDQLLAKYVEAAMKHRHAMFKGNHRAANKAADILETIRRDLQAYGVAGQERFLGLLHHEDGGVRGIAAAHALEFAPDKSVPVLQSLAEAGGLIGFIAEKVLEEKVRKS